MRGFTLFVANQSPPAHLADEFSLTGVQFRSMGLTPRLPHSLGT